MTHFEPREFIFGRRLPVDCCIMATPGLWRSLRAGMRTLMDKSGDSNDRRLTLGRGEKKARTESLGIEIALP